MHIKHHVTLFFTPIILMLSASVMSAPEQALGTEEVSTPSTKAKVDTANQPNVEQLTQQLEQQIAPGQQSNSVRESYWLQVRAGEAGRTGSASDEHDVLINVTAERWMLFKENWISPLGAIAIVGSLLLVLLGYIIVGPIKLSAPLTGRKIPRWNRIDRTLHWSMVVVFFTLAITGFTMVYGKDILKPVLSAEVWGGIIYACKQVHNYIGPLFFVLLLAMLIKWGKRNIFSKVDSNWLAKMGGMVGKHKNTHPSAGFSNAAEKILFWSIIIAGTLLTVTGFILDFPLFGQSRNDMAQSNMVHIITAIMLICGIIGHIYIGVAGIEHSLEAMVKGEVDETWAREHHDLWYAEWEKQQQQQPSSANSQADPSRSEPKQS